MAVQPKVWTREEYDRLIALGIFESGDRVELLDGEILQVTPQGARHAATISLVEDALRQAFPDAYVRTQMPFAPAGTPSEPEPDVAVVGGTPRDYVDRVPGTALLVVEVADTTLEHDRSRKGPVYAAGGIPEYWILDLRNHLLEIYRDPYTGPSGEAAYRNTSRAAPPDRVAPVLAPRSSIRVADLLP